MRVVDISSDSIQIFGFTDQRWDVRFSLSTGHTDEARLSYTNVTRKTARRQVLPLLSAATNLSLAVGGVGVGVRGAVGRETGPGGGRGLSDDRAHVGRPNTLRPSRAVRPGRMRKCFGAQRGISLPCGHQLRNKRKGRTLGPAKTKILMYVIVITFCTKKIRRCRNRFVGCRKLVPAGRIARQLFCEANLTNDVINNKIMIRRACYHKGITVKIKKIAFDK